MSIVSFDLLERDDIELSTSSSSLTHHHNDVYDVAIALNNAGVTLMQQQDSCCYALAIESFRDALQVMKLATAANDNQDDDIDININVELLSNMMTNISKRFIECYRIQQQQQQVLSESTMNTNNCPNLLSHNNFSILKYDGTVSSLSNAAIDTDIFDDERKLYDDNNAGTMESNSTDLSMKQQQQQQFAIHIVVRNHHLRLSYYEIDTAIILYNYGIAYSLLLHYCQHNNDHTEIQNKKDDIVLLNKAKRLFLLSYDLLHHISLNDDISDNNSDEHLTIIVLLLSCLVTISLFHNAMDSDTPPNEALYYYRFIRYLRYKYQIIVMNNSKHDVDDVYNLWEFDIEQHSAAAA